MGQKNFRAVFIAACLVFFASAPADAAGLKGKLKKCVAATLTISTFPARLVLRVLSLVTGVVSVNASELEERLEFEVPENPEVT